MTDSYKLEPVIFGYKESSYTGKWYLKDSKAEQVLPPMVLFLSGTSEDVTVFFKKRH